MIWRKKESGGPAAHCEKFIYDGWNLIPVLDAADSNSVVKTYTWGLDLSQSLQGAGGVGGLLAVTEHDPAGDETYHPTYDANGNVSEYIDDSGTVVAHYEYCPFGQLTVATGTKADDFVHRFSTKYLDSETELYYYGYRYYSAVLGRWLNRDPIGEQGGLNLYGFVGNQSLNQIDPNGQIALVAGLLAQTVVTVVVAEQFYYAFQERGTKSAESLTMLRKVQVQASSSTEKGSNRTGSFQQKLTDYEGWRLPLRGKKQIEYEVTVRWQCECVNYKWILVYGWHDRQGEFQYRSADGTGYCP